MHRDITKAPGPLRPGLVEEVIAAFKADQRARRAKREAFIGPRQRKPRRPLADAAQAHIDAGGCAMELCRPCKGQGLYEEEYDRGKYTEAPCWCCRGSGLRFNVERRA
ncbi:hypothetical protein [Salipiger thiooxidans]|uniref:hypothetical protein n=1 Tax=Salipiger thiooxidans TaxID=282683 RepID=UPI001CD5121B|nr:hypothetical protein [Salipiger thiooxidans]MCA0846087.1 hypothetical protein [Salipiger thiooxidans]